MLVLIRKNSTTLILSDFGSRISISIHSGLGYRTRTRRHSDSLVLIRKNSTTLILSCFGIRIWIPTHSGSGYKTRTRRHSDLLVLIRKNYTTLILKRFGIRIWIPIHSGSGYKTQTQKRSGSLALIRSRKGTLSTQYFHSKRMHPYPDKGTPLSNAQKQRGYQPRKGTQIQILKKRPLMSSSQTWTLEARILLLIYSG